MCLPEFMSPWAFVWEALGSSRIQALTKEKMLKAGQHVVYIFLMSQRTVSMRPATGHNYLIIMERTDNTRRQR